MELGNGENVPFFGWGANTGGYYGYWHMLGADPNAWPAVYTNMGGSWDYHPGGLVEYLLAKLSKTFPDNTEGYLDECCDDEGYVAQYGEPYVLEYREPYFEPWLRPHGEER